MIGGVEERRGVAARSARSAIMARRKSTMLAREHGAASTDDGVSGASGGRAQDRFAAARTRRRHVKLAARQCVTRIVAAIDADELIDAIVVRRDVRVRDGPGNF